MKRKTLYFVALISVILLLASCAKQENMIQPDVGQTASDTVQSEAGPTPSDTDAPDAGETVPDTELSAQTLGVSDSLTAGSPYNVSDIWKTENWSSHQRSGAPSQVTITFNGKEYTGTYQKTRVSNYRTYESDYYEFKGGKFSVKSTDGSFESIEFYALGSASKKLDDMRDKAYELASAYIDPADCMITEAKEDFLLCFTFYPKLLKGKSNATVQVTFCTNEDLEYFIAAMIPEMESALEAIPEDRRESKIDRLRSDEAVQCVVDYVLEKYPGCTYEVRPEGQLIALPDGGIGMIYTVVVEIPDGEIEGEPAYIDDMIAVLVTAE